MQQIKKERQRKDNLFKRRKESVSEKETDDFREVLTKSEFKETKSRTLLLTQHQHHVRNAESWVPSQTHLILESVFLQGPQVILKYF